jgi:hypothetical protein
MNKEIKLTILFAVLVVLISGAVFAYLANSNWPDVETSYLNMHLFNQNRVEKKNAKQTATAVTAPALMEYTDAANGISFKYPSTWAIAPVTAANPTLALTMGEQKVELVRYANPKMRKTLADYLTAKLTYTADVDYSAVTPVTLASGLEAYKITVAAKGAVASYDQTWIKASDTMWLAVGNAGAPADVIANVVSTLAITK